MAGFLESKLMKDIAETGKLPTVSFAWEEENFMDCMVGFFILAISVIIVLQLVKRFA